MKKKYLLGILLIFIIGSLTAVMAVENGENVTYNHYGNGTYVFNDIDNNTVNGYCLNSTKANPTVGSNMSVSNDTSSIDIRIKELIVTYYRGDSSENQATNVAIRTAIWNITNHQTLGGSNSLASQMMANITANPLGEIRNSYTFSDGVYNYIFNFFLGTASSSSTQPMLLFTFLQELIPEIPDEPPDDPSNETNITNNITNNTTNNTINNTTNNTINNVANKTEKPSYETNTTIIKAIEDIKLNMPKTTTKPTGIPLTTILVALTILGILVGRKQ